ncbi:MAG: hypothetical protein SF162_20575 [bacterium]|nr:hypothetical protein [bacterium]
MNVPGNYWNNPAATQVPNFFIISNLLAAPPFCPMLPPVPVRQPPTPTPTLTPSATATATSTPEASWGTTGVVRISVADTIPRFENVYPACVRDNFTTSRLPCAIAAYNQYRLNLGGTITWGQFAALVAYSEGNTLLNADATGAFRNPQDLQLGECWRRAAGQWFSGRGECNVPSVPDAPGIQNDFVYAVWEWLLKECATATGFVGSAGIPDYELNGMFYNGECNEDGLIRFLVQVQSLYQDTSFQYSPNLYLDRMSQEYAFWGWYDGSLRRYRYGICPCTWGNVATQDQARTGTTGINSGNSFSYFYFYQSASQFAYFKVY